MEKQKQINGVGVIMKVDFTSTPPIHISWIDNSEDKHNTREIVAIHDNQIVGFIHLYLYKSKGHLSSMHVKEQYRRNKIGSKLVAAAEELSKGRMMTTLQVLKGNSDAIKFWTSLGYHVSDVSDETCVLWMTKSLEALGTTQE